MLSLVIVASIVKFFIGKKGIVTHMQKNQKRLEDFTSLMVAPLVLKEYMHDEHSPIEDNGIIKRRLGRLKTHFKETYAGRYLLNPEESPTHSAATANKRMIKSDTPGIFSLEMINEMKTASNVNK